MLIKPFTLDIKSEEPEDSDYVKLDFTKNSTDAVLITGDNSDYTPGAKKKSRKKSNGTDLFTAPPHMATQVAEDFSVANNRSDRSLSIIESNEPYANKYLETDAILRSAIAQLDANMMELQRDLNEVRRSKTLRNKYTYMASMQDSLSNMISNKISAARELNNTISKCNDMELKRYKEVNAVSSASKLDEDQRIMEMYRAYVNTPVNSTPFPNVGQMALSNPIDQDIIMAADQSAMYNQYVSNMTPQQTMMHVADNPNVKQVVVYNQETGARYFEIMDMSTGMPVPNAEAHDSMFLEDIDLDLKNQVARNVNLGETYPLVIVGKPLMNEY